MTKLNCDMGESFGIYRAGNDEEIMPLIDIANNNNCINWMGFKLGSTTIYFRITYYSNGCPVRKIPTYKKPDIKEKIYDRIKLRHG